MANSKEENERIRKVIEQTQKMRAVPKELKAIAKDIVKKSKETAHDRFLKDSIYYVVDLDGVINFNGDSQLLENIKSMFPADVPYKYNGNLTKVIKIDIENDKSLNDGGKQSFFKRLKGIFK